MVTGYEGHQFFLQILYRAQYIASVRTVVLIGGVVQISIDGQPYGPTTKQR